MGKTFREWVLKQVEREDPVGDIARDFNYATTMPAWEGRLEGSTIEECLCHMENQGFCEEAGRAFLEAVTEYLQKRLCGFEEEE